MLLKDKSSSFSAGIIKSSTMQPMMGNRYPSDGSICTEMQVYEGNTHRLIIKQHAHILKIQKKMHAYITTFGASFWGSNGRELSLLTISRFIKLFYKEGTYLL